MKQRDHPGYRSGPTNRMVSSKSAGNIVAVDQYGAPISPQRASNRRNLEQSKRAKSDYVYPNDDDLQQQYIESFKKAQSRENQAFHAPKQQYRSHHRPQSAGKSSNSSSGGLTPRRSQHHPKSAVTPNDVFSPPSDLSSSRSNRSGGGQVCNPVDLSAR